jgi:hypothetical protein
MTIRRYDPPLCTHGYMVLACPHEACPTLLGYLDELDGAMRAFYRRQKDEARQYMREMLLDQLRGADPMKKPLSARMAEARDTLAELNARYAYPETMPWDARSLGTEIPVVADEEAIGAQA